MSNTNYIRIDQEVTVKVFPDNGPDQGKLAEWVRENGHEAKLYDGCVVQDVETSTDANWRWVDMHIIGVKRWAQVGDYIVKEGPMINVYDPETFNKIFAPVDCEEVDLGPCSLPDCSNTFKYDEVKRTHGEWSSVLLGRFCSARCYTKSLVSKTTNQ